MHACISYDTHLCSGPDILSRSLEALLTSGGRWHQSQPKCAASMAQVGSSRSMRGIEARLGSDERMLYCKRAGPNSLCFSTDLDVLSSLTVRQSVAPVRRQDAAKVGGDVPTLGLKEAHHGADDALHR